MDRAYISAQRALALLLLAVGIGMVVAAVRAGGGPLAFGVVLGVLFTGLGAARLWLALRARPRGER